MVESDLQAIPLVDLLVELLLNGRAGYLVDLASLEPMNLAAILAELRTRTGKDYGADCDAWCTWFLGSLAENAENERRSIEFARIKRRLRAFERHARQRYIRSN